MKTAITHYETTEQPAPAADHSKLRVAVIHDWLVVYGGAERVLEHVLDCYPQADLFSLIDFVPADQRHFMRGKRPQTSFLQSIPGVARHYRKLLPIMPLAIEQFDLSGYDLVISSSYCVAKGVMTGPNQVHVSYCHSPMRYAWDHYHEYLNELDLQRGPKSWFARWQLHKIRTWDVRSSNTVDHFVANSKFVQARISKYYGRDSNLVYPPIDTSTFQLEANKEDFYVAAGRFVPFKRLDLVVDAFAAMPEKKLVMLGDGPEMAKLRSKSGPNIEFLGFQPPEVMSDYLSRARAFLFPSEEDFGIVPVEAQACGTPVIAYGSGGALETVLPVSADRPASQATGIWFPEQTPQSIIDAVHRFEAEADRFDPAFISEHAASFSPESFKSQLVAQIEGALVNRVYAPERCADSNAAAPLSVIDSGTPGSSPVGEPTMAVEREVSRFGVPVSLRDARAAGTLLATALDSASAVDSTTVITCAGWKELELAGRDRNYQYALNNADLVLPRDPELLDVLCEGRPDSGSYTHMTPFSAEFFRLCAASGKRVFILTGDSISPTSASRMYAARAHGMEILGAWQIPAEGSDTGSLLAKLAACRPDVLLIAGAGKSTDEWVALHRAVLSVPLILSLALEEQAPQSARSVPTLERLQQISRRFSRSREISAGRWWRQLTLQAGMKRALDLCCASLGLLILSPVLLTTATLIRLESEGPVLFRQRRVGLRGRTFTMFKFRSMYADAEARLLSLRDRNESEGNTLFKMKRDPRVTLVGRFIRRFSIDELPQLINVLRGDMAVVGPRPALPSEVEGYDLEARKRLQVKPGLTCFWQIGGRSDLSFDDQIKLDLDYMGSQSVAQDFSIVLKTVPAVLSGKGAY